MNGEGEGGEAGGEVVNIPREYGDGMRGEETRARRSINLYTPESLESGVTGAVEGAYGLPMGVDGALRGVLGPEVLILALVCDVSMGGHFIDGMMATRDKGSIPRHRTGIVDRVVDMLRLCGMANALLSVGRRHSCYKMMVAVSMVVVSRDLLIKIDVSKMVVFETIVEWWNWKGNGEVKVGKRKRLYKVGTTATGALRLCTNHFLWKNGTAMCTPGPRSEWSSG